MRRILSQDFLEKCIDEEMRYAIYNLNRKGYLTAYCCQGHWLESRQAYCGAYLGFKQPIKRECWPALPTFPWRDDNRYASSYTTPVTIIGSGNKNTIAGKTEAQTFYWEATRKKRVNREEKDLEHEQFIKELNAWVDSLPDNCDENSEEMIEERNNSNMSRLFVYGTLMKGQRAEKMMTGAKYLGNYRLADYAMYDLGAYPGIKECVGESVVGEVYEITDDMLPGFDRYEGEGSLYKRITVEVSREEEKVEAYVYMFIPEVHGEPMRETWNASEEDYVWYACYGSNLNADRFNNYIEGGVYELTGAFCEGCRDKSHWVDDCMKTYPGRMYFAMNSSRWENKGVSFYDPNSNNGYTYMRLYKITRGQFHDVQRHEGPSWYGRIVCLDVLSDNCPVYTMTSKRILEDNMPGEKYLNLIRTSLMENLSQGEFEVDNYLAGCSDEMKRIVSNKYEQKSCEYDEKRKAETNVRYSSEVFALNCPPVEAFKIVVEETVDGECHTVTVKKVFYSYCEPYHMHDEIVLSKDTWNE